jgi:glycosyltransferase involved in cell wall biosynthesis
MEKNRRIIFISPQNVFNPKSGVESRISNLVRILSKDNTVIIFAPIQKVDPKMKNYYGLDYSNRLKKLYDKRIMNMSSKLKADIVFGSTIWSGINGYILSKKLNIPFYFDEHNVEFLRFKRTGSILWPLVYLFERFICKKADKVSCVSETDKNYLVSYFNLKTNKVKVIENPVNKSVFYSTNKNNNKIREEIGLKNNEKLILFFGQLNYQPNVEALQVIKDEILPRLNKINKNYKIVVCGKGDGNGLLKKFSHPNLIFRGFVERIQDYINASDTVIVPLKSGSGTRIKILEALACKKRVISTKIGAEGIKQQEKLIVVDNCKWNKFVNAIKDG